MLSLKIKETSPPHFTPASILLQWTASGPSRFVRLRLSQAPSSTWNPSTHHLLLLLHPQSATRGMLRQHYKSQAVQYLFYLHLSDSCCCRSSSWAAVLCVLVLFAGVFVVCVIMCPCARVHPQPVWVFCELVVPYLHGIQMHVLVWRWRSAVHAK